MRSAQPLALVANVSRRMTNFTSGLRTMRRRRWIRVIVDAQQVAMHQQHASPVQRDHGAVVQQLDAGVSRQKRLPIRKIAVAVDERRSSLRRA
jgi:hypothetical protein